MGRPYKIRLGNRLYWVHHFTLDGGEGICDISLDKVPRYFSDLFESIWNQHSENDDFNRLLFSACIKARNIQVIRAYTVYLNQIRFPHSRSYIIEALNTYPEITLLLVKCFLHKFDPQIVDRDSYRGIIDTINEKLLDIESLDHDLIYKRMVNLIESTIRTNYFRHITDEANCISFKLDSGQIQGLPKPSPRYEIFVYSPRFEGIHLRGGPVARGGIRWSDRKEDYRTEVLGLMKAQMVKNAVIVPAGSKGGFITKKIAHLPASEVYPEVQACYSLYIDALLELTDNLVNQEVRHPKNTSIYDSDDPYLVVAADKGTAAFSDVANAISEKHEFWLDDAFASGGSQGYDHKKMGITARGAWESVKRHFRGLGKDIQKQPFTVVGIGDMAGDVFGNGMLLSPCIQLVAAFNHIHIFLDPNPNIKNSYAERQRLFGLARSTWNDYKKSLISKGGGIFLRKAKRIDLSPEIQQLIDCKEDHLTPNELINYILKAQVDLIWNGGIGTYVKATTETNTAVSDKSNDEIRITGKQVRAKAIGEGGNLGLTQRGRIEYAQNGGLIYTDSIDNSAGVDCSDNEVNIKILLSPLVKSGRLSMKDRNALLTAMTDEVGAHCLFNNYRQTQIIDSIVQHAAANMHQHARFMRHLEHDGILNRKLENLPNDEQITERIAQNKGLTRPELSILLSYSKLTYKNALLESSSLSEECYNHLLLEYFPKKLQQLYADEILQHPLRKEIIATLLSNMITNNIGIGFGYRIREETGATIENIAKAYVVCVNIFELDNTWRELEQLDNVVQEHCRYECFRAVSGLLERSISWLLRNKSASFDVSHLIERYKTDIKVLRKVIPGAIVGRSRKEDHLTPNELINYILKARVDLIWNGGIGTYVKATTETNTAVSDKSNDEIRITGKQVRAKAIGEGGNLGLTQRGRIEYAQNGGLIYTDSIDNSAGVDCSDNEVNIKILLSPLVKSGRLSMKDRNALLTAMTDEVGAHCLFNNYRQTQIIDSIVQHAAANMHQHARFMRHLEHDGILNRKLENLPNDEQITERIAQNKGLTRPELSILLSYSKLTYKNALLESSSLSEECYNHLLLEYFPKKLQQLYADEILQHPLRKEIIATLLSNMITNNIGIGFGYRIREETGATIENIAKAYVVCVNIFELDNTWRELEQLDNVVQEHCRYECFRAVSGLLERSISWLLRNKSASFDVSHLIERYKTDIKVLRKAIPGAIVGRSRKNYLAERKKFIKYKLPAALAHELADKTTLASAFDIIEIKSKLYSSTDNTAKLFYALSERLQLHWIRNAISQTIVRSHWNHLAIVNMSNDLHANQRNLTEMVLHSIDNKRHTTKALTQWERHHHEALDRYDHIVSELNAMRTLDFSVISVAVSEVRRLVSLSKLDP